MLKSIVQIVWEQVLSGMCTAGLGWGKSSRAALGSGQEWPRWQSAQGKSHGWSCGESPSCGDTLVEAIQLIVDSWHNINSELGNWARLSLIYVKINTNKK